MARSAPRPTATGHSSCLLHPINSPRPRSKNGENYHFMYCRPAGVGHWAEQSSKCQECTHLTTSTYLSGWEPSVPRQRERGGAVQRPPYPAREVGRRGARIGSQRDSKHSEETQTQTVLFKRTPIAVCPRGVTRIFPSREERPIPRRNGWVVGLGGSLYT